MTLKQILHRLGCIALLLLLAGRMYGQEGLAIASVFQKYARQKGSTYVEMTQFKSQVWDASLYKSLTVKRAAKVLPTIYEALDKDRDKAKKVNEIVHDGVLRSGYYMFEPTGGKTNRFIVFRMQQDDTVYLLYIEGEITDEKMSRQIYGF
ncbi:MAG: hypothetical protein LBM62_00950 [Mediterranea sp.]|jgi:hypothetical protein|nr:hypothetical protein [Mediterranea sp.]